MRISDWSSDVCSSDLLVIDKTGTLTEGKPSVTCIVVGEGWDESELLRLAAGVERASEHPLGQAIVAAAEARKLALPEVSSFDSPTGKGAVGTASGYIGARSEEHTSELQSLMRNAYAVFCLKKKTAHQQATATHE